MKLLRSRRHERMHIRLQKPVTDLVTSKQTRLHITGSSDWAPSSMQWFFPPRLLLIRRRHDATTIARPERRQHVSSMHHNILAEAKLVDVHDIVVARPGRLLASWRDYYVILPTAGQDACHSDANTGSIVSEWRKSARPHRDGLR